MLTLRVLAVRERLGLLSTRRAEASQTPRWLKELDVGLRSFMLLAPKEGRRRAVIVARVILSQLGERQPVSSEILRRLNKSGC